jgi:hypothetical protein
MIAVSEPIAFVSSRTGILEIRLSGIVLRSMFARRTDEAANTVTMNALSSTLFVSKTGLPSQVKHART